MYAVGAHQDVGGDPRVVVESDLDVVAAVGEPNQSVSQMNALRREGRRNNRQQIGPVDRHMRGAVEFLA